MSWRPAALALCLALAGCGGIGALEDGLCDDPSWQCITSTPVYGSREPVVPNPGNPRDAAEHELERRMKAMIAKDRRHRVVAANGMELYPAAQNVPLPRGHVRRFRQLDTLAGTVDGGRIAPAAGEGADERQYRRRWRHAADSLYLGGRPRSGAEFRFSDVQAIRTEIALHNIRDEPLDLRLTCDGPAELTGAGAARRIGAGLRLRLPARADGRIRIVPAADTDRCEIAWEDERRRSITLRRDQGEPALDGRYDVCAAPSGRLSPLETVFHADRWLSQTCILRTGRIRLLPEAEEAFNAKVEALLGRPLPPSFIAAGDPTAPIEFADTPRLSLIYASYLDIKADFSGMVFTRLLRHHAERGVPIRILVTGIMQRDKDRVLVEQLAADHPNVRLQEFAWRAPRGSAYDELAAQIHRAHHIKLLAVLSDEPGRSRAIFGGRNIHDGFLFRQPLDLTAWPQLHTYEGARKLTLNYYSNYRDFEIEVADDDAVAAMAAHLSTVWNRDAETHMAQPFSVQRQGGGPRRGARHFISVPYQDGGALERYYVELIDAAEHSIEIANPYLNPPPAIEEALLRAAARGVRITIVARIDLNGDLGGEILTELNQMFVEKHAGHFTIYSYREPDVVLHSKLLMIDGALTVISSVNFNHRSFLHDSENGLAIYDPDEYRRVREIFENYRRGSTLLDGNVRRSPLYRLLLGSRLLREAL